LYSTTPDGAAGGFPDDWLRRLLRGLVRAGGLLEPHDPSGVRLSLSEVFALGELADAGTLSQQELADRLGLEKSTVSRLAANLERREWLTRERDPANRRFYRLRLTGARAEGREAGRRTLPLLPCRAVRSAHPGRTGRPTTRADRPHPRSRDHRALKAGSRLTTDVSRTTRSISAPHGGSTP